MRQDDQKQSLLDYVKFILAMPVKPGTEPEITAIRNAHQRLQNYRGGPLNESLLAMDLTSLLYKLKDKKLRLGH